MKGAVFGGATAAVCQFDRHKKRFCLHPDLSNAVFVIIAGVRLGELVVGGIQDAGREDYCREEETPCL